MESGGPVLHHSLSLPAADTLGLGMITYACMKNPKLLIALDMQDNRLGKPEELQAIAVYLAGDASPFTTGSDFVIDGAFTCF